MNRILMKNTIFLFLFTAAFSSAAQWTGTGSSLSTTATELIMNSSRQPTATFWLTPKSSGPNTTPGNYYFKAFDYWGSTLHFQGTGDNGNERMTVTIDGKLGVGTASPTQRLDVNGYLKVGGTSYTNIQLADRDWSGSHAILFNAYTSSSFVNGSLATTGNTKFYNDKGSFSGGAGGIFFDGNGGTMHFRISDASTGKGNDINWGTAELTIKRNGRVGIGTSNPDTKLTVKGTVHAEEVKVDLNVPAPDYVFEPDYDLRTLHETRSYITMHKHLPEIPSAAEMEAEGLALGDMNMRLLKKIEELTLYVIQQNEAQQTQQNRISDLEKKITQLEKQIKEANQH